MSDKALTSPPDCRHFTASDGVQLAYFYVRSSAQTSRGIIVSLHGIQSHSGWYFDSAQAYASAGFEVYLLDRRGTGKSSGERGHTRHAERLLSDVRQFLNHIRHQSPQGSGERPIILMAHSWGARLAALLAAKAPFPFDALALLSPGICPLIKPNAWDRLRLSVAKRLGITHRQIPIPLSDPALFTHETVWQDFIQNDDLALREMTTGLLIAGEHLQRQAISAGPRITVPLLMALAGRDEIIDVDATRRYFRSINSKQKTLLEYSQARHTLEFEPNRQQIFSEIIEGLTGLL